MLFQANPLLLSELHPLPVIVAGGILPAELHSPRFTGRALGSSNMSLKLDRICAGYSYRIDEGMRNSEAAVVGLSHLTNDQTTAPMAVRAGGLLFKKVSE